MNIACPSCGAGHEVPASRLAEVGSLTCRQCGMVFSATTADLAPPAAGEEDFEPVAGLRLEVDPLHDARPAREASAPLGEATAITNGHTAEDSAIRRPRFSSSAEVVAPPVEKARTPRAKPEQAGRGVEDPAGAPKAVPGPVGVEGAAPGLSLPTGGGPAPEGATGVGIGSEGSAGAGSAPVGAFGAGAGPLEVAGAGPAEKSALGAVSASAGAIGADPASAGAVGAVPASAGAVGADSASAGAVGADPASAGAISADPAAVGGVVTGGRGRSSVAGAVDFGPGPTGALGAAPGPAGAVGAVEASAATDARAEGEAPRHPEARTRSGGLGPFGSSGACGPSEGQSEERASNIKTRSVRSGSFPGVDGVGSGVVDPFDGPDMGIDAALAEDPLVEPSLPPAVRRLGDPLEVDDGSPTEPGRSVDRPARMADPAALEPTVAGEPIPHIPVMARPNEPPPPEAEVATEEIPVVGERVLVAESDDLDPDVAGPSKDSSDAASGGAVVDEDRRVATGPGVDAAHQGALYPSLGPPESSSGRAPPTGASTGDLGRGLPRSRFAPVDPRLADLEPVGPKGRRGLRGSSTKPGSPAPSSPASAPKAAPGQPGPPPWAPASPQGHNLRPASTSSEASAGLGPTTRARSSPSTGGPTGAGAGAGAGAGPGPGRGPAGGTPNRGVDAPTWTTTPKGGALHAGLGPNDLSRALSSTSRPDTRAEKTDLPGLSVKRKPPASAPAPAEARPAQEKAATPIEGSPRRMGRSSLERDGASSGRGLGPAKGMAYEPLDPDLPPAQPAPASPEPRRLPFGGALVLAFVAVCGGLFAAIGVGVSRGDSEMPPSEPIESLPAILAGGPEARAASLGPLEAPELDQPRLAVSEAGTLTAPVGRDDDRSAAEVLGSAVADRAAGPSGDAETVSGFHDPLAPPGYAYIGRRSRLRDRVGGRPGARVEPGTEVRRLASHHGWVLVLVGPAGPAGFLEADSLSERKPVEALAAEIAFEGCSGAAAGCLSEARRQHQRCLERCAASGLGGVAATEAPNGHALSGGRAAVESAAGASQERCQAACRIAHETCQRGCRR